MPDPIASPNRIDDPRPTAKDPAAEVLPGGASRGAGYYPGPRILPQSSDDISRAFGPELYEAMLLDAGIAGPFLKLVTSALSGRVHVVPTDQRTPGQPDSPEALRAEEVAEDNRRQVAGLDIPIEDVLREMLYAVPMGCKLAELVRHPGLVDGKHKLRRIAPKPWWAWRFGVDRVGNVIGYLPPTGFVPDLPGADSILGQGPLLDPRDFALLTWDARDGGPQGSSLLRPCYPWWNMARQAMPDYPKFVHRFASPKPVGRFLPPAGDNLQGYAGGAALSSSYAAAEIDVIGADGLPTGERITAAGAMQRIVATIDNDTGAVLPDGAVLEFLEPKTDGAAFGLFFEYCDRKKAAAILTSARAVLEAEHGSKADTNTADTSVDSVAYLIARWLGRWLYGIFYRINVDNFGEADARRYTPEFSIGDESGEDRVALFGAVSAGGYTLHDSAFPAIDAQLEVPVRPDDWRAQDAARAAEAMATAQANAPGGDQQGTTTKGEADGQGKGITP